MQIIVFLYKLKCIMITKILLLAGSAVLMASCGSNNNIQVQAHQIDSIVNVKASRHDAENAARNDSTLKAIEMQKADTIAKARLEEKKKNEKSQVAPPSLPTTPPLAPQATPGKH